MAVTGSFTAAGQSAIFAPRPTIGGAGLQAGFNVSVWGAFVGSVQLERSFDNGVTWFPITGAAVQLGLWIAPASEVFEEPEAGVIYRLNCTAYTSGTINYRVSQ